MRYLLCQVFKIIVDELESFTQKRIKRLCHRFFDRSERGHHVHGNESVPAYRVLFFCGQVEQIVVFHRLGTFLKQTRGVVKVHRHSNARHVFTNHILQDCPDTRPGVGILQPRESISLQWLVCVARLDVPVDWKSIVSDFNLLKIIARVSSLIAMVFLNCINQQCPGLFL